MSNFLTKVKGVVFVIAGVLWLVGVFASFWPTVSIKPTESFMFLLASICGFSVMTYGVSWINNNEE